jgi:hypothetical protein
MKIYRSLPLLLLVVIFLASCDHNVSMETTVHEDGSLDKTVIFENKDSSKNILGLGEEKGWQKSVSHKVDTVLDKDTLGQTSKSVAQGEYITTFKKSFASAEAANAELAVPNDSLFQVTSKFEKKFKWFYTYICYSETYHSLNRMDLKPDDYLTPEDYAFIDRLPAEGKKISKADNFYLSELNNRIFDVYGTKAFYEEYFTLNLQLIKDNKLENRWVDTLNAHKEDIFELLENKKNLQDDYILTVMDSLHIPLDYKKAKEQYDGMFKKLNAKTNFITTANDGKYVNRINMPWPVVTSNADSTAGNSLFWAPPTLKFLLKDYTMYGEARKLNWWAVIVSVLIVGFTGYLFIRKSEIVIQTNNRKISIPRKDA